jgi:aspartyl-tRNA(Asn)/glutamyl-tRNA(Gln) amidotransferase subunit B
MTDAAFMPDGWELVVGLEVHVELDTATKMWCGCATTFGDEPNTNVCAVCTGQPGALPVVNARAVDDAILLGLAINGHIAPICQFHRKNYFYPDLAKNYQISQYDVPLVSDGYLDVDVDIDGEIVTRRVGIERLHMEEDTGKSLHVGESGRLHGADRSLIDYNRCGIPLLEIVSHPEIHDPATAQAYLRELQAIVVATGVSPARMDHGQMRCDANVSVRRFGDPLGTRTEIKNLNSVRSLGRAVRYEALRQVDEITGGGTIRMETRHWDETRGVTETLRVKESVTDYRYFPDPDLVSITATPEKVAGIKAAMPELPAQMRQRLYTAGLNREQAQGVIALDALGVYDDAVARGADPSRAAQWLVGDISGALSEGMTVHEAGITGAHLHELLSMIDDGQVSHTMAKTVLSHLIDARGAASPKAIAEQHNLVQLQDTDALRTIAEAVVAENAETVQAIRDGNAKAIGALVGAVMQRTSGQADPRATNALLRELIDRDA